MANYEDAEDRARVQTSSEFIGWHIGRNTVPVSCQAGIPWTTNSDGFGGCCPSPQDGCPLRTDCISNTGYWDNGSQSACGEGRACRTMHVYEDYVPGSWAETSVLAIMCVSTTWSWDTVFNAVAVETASEASSISSPTATITSDSSESTASSTSQSTTPTPTPDPGDDSDGGSLAWVAGAVIGPVVLIAAIGFFIWWYKRRSAKKGAAVAAAAAAAPLPPGQDESAPAMAYNNYNGYNGYNNNPEQPWGYPQQGQQMPYNSPFSQQSTAYQPDAHGGYYQPPPQGSPPMQHGGYYAPKAAVTSELDSGQHMRPTQPASELDSVHTSQPSELPAQHR